MVEARTLTPYLVPGLRLAHGPAECFVWSDIVSVGRHNYCNKIVRETRILVVLLISQTVLSTQ